MAQDVMGFLESQVAFIEPQVYAIRYADIQYPRLVPVEMEAPEWIRTITHYSMDMVGKAEPLAGRANDIPLADVSRTQHEVTVEMAGIGYDYTEEELQQAMMLGRSLNADKASAARRAAEQYIDDKVLNGDANYGWDGLLNNTSIPKADVADGAAGTKDWSTKTADEIITDINGMLTGLWTGTKTVAMADTLALPAESLTLIGTKRLPDTNLSILGYLRDNNVYTVQTGSPLLIVLLRGLENAAAGSKGRMLAYRRSPDVLKLHLPMPHKFYPPQQRMFQYVVPGIFRLGGLEIRLPNEMRYGDIITP